MGFVTQLQYTKAQASSQDMTKGLMLTFVKLVTRSAGFSSPCNSHISGSGVRDILEIDTEGHSVYQQIHETGVIQNLSNRLISTKNTNQAIASKHNLCYNNTTGKHHRHVTNQQFW